MALSLLLCEGVCVPKACAAALPIACRAGIAGAVTEQWGRTARGQESTGCLGLEPWWERSWQFSM